MSSHEYRGTRSYDRARFCLRQNAFQVRCHFPVTQAIVGFPKTERVEAVCATNNGFELAERDLALRGSGELLGTQQSGFSELRALDPIEDLDVLLQVRKAVRGEDSDDR